MHERTPRGGLCHTQSVRCGASPSSGSRIPGGGAADASDEASMSDYLHFGRLIGERPEAVQQQLEATSVAVAQDDADDYLERWAPFGFWTLAY